MDIGGADVIKARERWERERREFGDIIQFRADWLEKRREDILDPDLPIIDAHHHLWDPPNARYLLPELLADTQSGHTIRDTVYVQCHFMHRQSGPEEFRPIGEVEFVLGVAKEAAKRLGGRGRLCGGIVGLVDLTLGDRAEPVLEEMIRIGGTSVCGVRYPTAAPPAIPHLLMDPNFRRGAARLAAHALPLDIYVFHTQLEEVLDFARSLPDLPVILNHVGGPVGIGPQLGLRAEVFAVWKKSMRQLALQRQVSVKLGGLGMRSSGFAFHEQAMPPSSAELAEAWRPYIESCIELFGANRCMFESNFSVDKGMFSYPVLWNAFKRLATGCSSAEKAALFSGTATAAYRLPPASA